MVKNGAAWNVLFSIWLALARLVVDSWGINNAVDGLWGFYVILILLLSGVPRGCRISFYDYVISHSIISTSMKSLTLP